MTPTVAMIPNCEDYRSTSPPAALDVRGDVEFTALLGGIRVPVGEQ